jgi:hypothetical protein
MTIPGMQHAVITTSKPNGVSLDEKLLPQYLKKSGIKRILWERSVQRFIASQLSDQ